MPASARSRRLAGKEDPLEAFTVEFRRQGIPNGVKAEGLTIAVRGRRLLDDAVFVIAEVPNQAVALETPWGEKTVRSGARYGLVGPNGSGKSTLMGLIERGDLEVPRGWSVHLVDQHPPEPAPQWSPVREVLNGSSERAAKLERCADLEARLESIGSQDDEAPLSSEDLDRLADEQQQIWDDISRDEAEVHRILVGLGFRDPATEGRSPSTDQPMATLSGGWRMRVELAKALWLKPRLLLLDEPTNHLDFPALLWLMDYLREYKHTVVIVSHDNSFLREVCTIILHITEAGQIRRMSQQEVSEDELVRMQKHPSRFHFPVAVGKPEDHGLSFHSVSFSYAASSSDSSADEQGGNTGHGNKASYYTLRDLDHALLRFSGRSRVVLLGENGSGKSTVVGLAIGKLTPTAGSVDRAGGCKIAYYSQHFVEEMTCCSAGSAAEYLLQRCRDALVQRERRRRTDRERLLAVACEALSRFGLDGHVAAAVPVQDLSGGQKARVNLAFLSLSPAHILFMDEPTNHLDAGACEALADALAKFEGGVVLVSHDEDFIRRVAEGASDSRFLACEEGGVHEEPDFGRYRQRLWRERAVRALQAAKVAEETAQAKARQRAGARRRPKTPCSDLDGGSERCAAAAGSAASAAMPPARAVDEQEVRRLPRPKTRKFKSVNLNAVHAPPCARMAAKPG